MQTRRAQETRVRAGVSVVRISGPAAKDVLLHMAPGRDGGLPEPRKAVLPNITLSTTEALEAPDK